jgi:hypothetical protein
MANSSEALIPSSCADISLENYNYTLHRAALAACNKLDGQRKAQILVTGFSAATYWISLDLILQLLSTFKRRQALYFW